MQKHDWIIGESEKLRAVLALMLVSLLASSALAVTKRLQICSPTCVSQACKKLAQEVEFEFEMSEDFLLPRCLKAQSALPKSEFRLVFSEDPSGSEILIELDCNGKEKCLSQTYAVAPKGGVLTAKVVSDVKLAIKLHKGVNAQVALEQKPALPQKVPPKVATKTQGEEEWDRVILVNPSDKKPASPAVVTETLQLKDAAVAAVAKKSTQGSVTMSFGGESWDYSFESSNSKERVAPLHSRIYPKLLLTTIYWPIPYLRASSQLAASVLTFRIKANQSVDGDGQLIFAHKYQSDVVVGYMKALGEIVHVGVEGGYEFIGAFVDNQHIAQKSVTLVPGFQSHALRVGPRIIIGENSDRGVIDVSAGFYPYIHYAENPDEPATRKSSFAWSVQGRVRLLLGPDIFADGTMGSHSLYVRYDEDPIRETVYGEKWGTGKVSSVSASATLGLGWLF